MRFRVYLAATVDGYIADRAGGVGFLDGYDPGAYGYADFVASVATVIAGRATYEQALGWAGNGSGDQARRREEPQLEGARRKAAEAADRRATHEMGPAASLATEADPFSAHGGVPWAGKRAVVLTSRALDGVETSADPAALAARLRAEDAGDAWIMGGGRTVRAFLDAGAVDELDLYLIPTLLGDGIRLFEPRPAATALALVEASTHARGVARLLYRRAA